MKAVTRRWTVIAVPIYQASILPGAWMLFMCKFPSISLSHTAVQAVTMHSAVVTVISDFEGDIHLSNQIRPADLIIGKSNQTEGT